MSPMFRILSEAAADAEPHLNLILLLGIAVLCGTIGAKVIQRLRTPQIIGEDDVLIRSVEYLKSCGM